MLPEYQQLLAKKKELIDTTRELDTYTENLLERKIVLINEIDDYTDKQIKPRKEEISQIDVEIENIMKQTGQQKVTIHNYGAYLSDEISIKVVDPVKALRWAMAHPQVIRKDILKAAEIIKLLKEGVVPDPKKDGVNCNDAYQKVSYRKR